MEPFFCPLTRKKLPGKHGQQDLIAAPPTPRETSKPFQNKHFPTWHGFRSVSCRTAAWESLAVRKRDPQTSLGGLGCGSLKGRTTDGEYASHRTFAADDAGTADGCRRQQRRERQHLGLQGRPVDVSGIPDLGRA